MHRDLKPANVVIRAADQTPKIIDFGLATARTAYAEDLLNTTFGGTIAYMAPEQAQQLISRYTGEAAPTVDERIDVFALGAILYGLTRVLHKSGVRSVLASQWKVEPAALNDPFRLALLRS